MSSANPSVLRKILASNEGRIALLALTGIALHLVLRITSTISFLQNSPLLVVLILGGGILVFQLARKILNREFGADLLAGISIVTAILLGEYLAGTIVVFMLSGGAALESFAVSKASSALNALANRMPNLAHRKQNDRIEEIDIAQIAIGDLMVIPPHEIAPCDGVVVEGNGSMDEAFLTGEPFQISKAPGSEVISGAVNGENAITIRATRTTADSRYAKISSVMRETQLARVPLRRLGDMLGAWYTPLAVAIAVAAWIVSGDSVRFLAVLVVATPCPLLLAIPVAVIGSVSLAAKLSIIIRDPAILERLDRCRTIILDKTGTLTYGTPSLSGEQYFNQFDQSLVLRYTATIEQYSKHPLAKAILKAAKDRNIELGIAEKIEEPPGTGMLGVVDGHVIRLTSRKQLERQANPITKELPETRGGLECIILIDQQLAAIYQFRDTPRQEGRSFISHLAPRHNLVRAMIVSGDRESEVRYLAGQVGIEEIHASKTPEEKVAIVREQTALAETIYIGDGINDAPALLAATVGIAFGGGSAVTSEAAGAVILEPSLTKVDELFHIARRMKRITLESAVGGMAFSLVGMGFAFAGLLPPTAGAITQEVIDLLAVLNALRAAYQPKVLTDYEV